MFTGIQAYSRSEMAAQVARDIEEGWCVNLGIGLPTQVAEFVPSGREVIFHSENGIIGMGPAPTPEKRDAWLVNAGKQYVTLLQGGSYVHHADSFALARGGRLDLCVLGAYEVSERGDLANWSLGGEEALPSIGGAMDLAVGARQIWVMMSLFTKAGASKILKDCTLPLTAPGCVKRIYTDYATLDVTPEGLVARTLAQGLTCEQLSEAMGLNIIPSS